MPETGSSVKRLGLITILVIFLFMFICSCCSTKTSSYSENPNQKREDEVHRIMRYEFLSSSEKSNDLTDKERRELRRLKQHIQNRSDSFLPVPLSSWTVRGPLDLTPYFEGLQEKRRKEPSYQGPAFDFMDKFKEGDEIFYYKSDPYSWSVLCGEEGYLLIRDNKIICGLIIAVN